MTPRAPDWLDRALAVPPEHARTQVQGVDIAYRSWGPVGAPGVLLVHGGAAHAGWWDHVAPLLPDRRVVALDLSGHGDSGQRSSYGLAQWAGEVLGVAEAAGLERPVVAGHSLGGWIAYGLAARHSTGVSAVVAIDAPLNDGAPAPERLAMRTRPQTVFADVQDAVVRWRAAPAQEVVLPRLRAHLVPASLRPVEGGWSWKFDPATIDRREPVRRLLPRLNCPTVLLRCEYGVVRAEVAAEMAALAGGRLQVVELPAAGHHPMLDQPLALVAALRAVLADLPTA